MFGTIFEEAKKLGRSPARLREVFRPRRWRQLFSILFFNARTGNRWKSAPDAQPFKQREYSSYEQYLRHQQSKFQYLDLADYDLNYRRQLKERLENVPFIKKGGNVLCLGARQGTEVKAFHDLGCFAVGLDLNPGPENKFVLHGDFHHVQFPAGSVDVVFTNSLDHAFDPAKLIGEIKRLLKPDGILIIEAIHGEAQSTEPDHYASFWWQHLEDLIALLTRHGFNSLRRVSFREPWPGDQICFELQKPGDVR
ncbi:MAG: hypothetical protein JWQ04_619 [Pedosphaera sp.]|nr:hypothetical protein [Pedosphaera sp.]